MSNSNKVKCLINAREFQIAIVFGIFMYFLSSNIPTIKLLRLTPSTYLRQHFLLLNPANIIGIFGSVLGGPWAGLIIALFTNNYLFDHGVDVIVNAAQYLLIGYFYRKINSSWNRLSILLGSILSIIFHPTLVGYFLHRRIVVYLYWETNMLFNAVLATTLYIVIFRFYPIIFRWTTLYRDRAEMHYDNMYH